jgi:hypothetical protein
MRLWPAWFGIAAAPLAWFAQLTLGYGLWAWRCYPGETPIVWSHSTGAMTTVIVTDVLAVLIGIAGFAVAWRIRQGVSDKKAHETLPTTHIGEARTRFLGSWGMLSSGCFLIAILFAVIMSVGAPLCE